MPSTSPSTVSLMPREHEAARRVLPERHVGGTSSDCGVPPASATTLESCIAKHDEWAAAISSSRAGRAVGVVGRALGERDLERCRVPSWSARPGRTRPAGRRSRRCVRCVWAWCLLVAGMRAPVPARSPNLHSWASTATARSDGLAIVNLTGLRCGHELRTFARARAVPTYRPGLRAEGDRAARRAVGPRAPLPDRRRAQDGRARAVRAHHARGVRRRRAVGRGRWLHEPVSRDRGDRPRRPVDGHHARGGGRARDQPDPHLRHRRAEADAGSPTWSPAPSWPASA